MTKHATTMHVLGGQCQAVEHRAAAVRQMEEGVGDVGKAEKPARQGGAGKHRGETRRATRVVEADTPVTRMAKAAAKALRNSTGAHGMEAEALRRMMAGDIPRTARDDEDSESARKRIRRIAEGVKKVQRGAADLLRG